MTKSYNELLQKSGDFLNFLKNEGVESFRREDSFRDYNVKLVAGGSTVVMYHKPTKKTFSISTHEIKSDEQKLKIEELWSRYQNGDSKPVSGLCAYVDGSFYKGQTGWGLVIVEDGKVLHKDGGKLDLPKEEASHQIAGEAQGVIEALIYARDKGVGVVNIFYDYTGLKHWACNEWKASSSVAVNYKKRLQDFDIKINWIKVKAHTGNRFNEMADKLAKGI